MGSRPSATLSQIGTIPFDTWAGAFRAGNSVLIDRVDDVSIGPVSPRALTALP